MSGYIYSKDTEAPIKSSGALYFSITNPVQLGNEAHRIISWNKNNQIFLKIDFHEIVDEKNIVSIKYRMLCFENPNITYKIYETNEYVTDEDQNIPDSGKLEISDWQGRAEIERVDARLISEVKSGDIEDLDGFIEFDLTNYVKERIHLGRKTMYVRISNNSSEYRKTIDPVCINPNFMQGTDEIELPQHADGLIVIVRDISNDCNDEYSLENGNAVKVDYIDGKISHLLPTYGIVSSSISNNRFQNKSNLLHNLFFSVKKHTTNFTVIDAFENEKTYRRITKEDAFELYKFENEDADECIFLNTTDFSFTNAEAIDAQMIFYYLDGSILEIEHDGNSFDSEGHKVFRLKKLTYKNGRYIEVNWNNSSEVIISDDDNNVNEVTLSNDKIDSINIPNFHRKVNFNYINHNNRYFLKDTKVFNCDELGDALVQTHEYVYDSNMNIQFHKDFNRENSVNYVYQDNKLKKLIIKNGLTEQYEYLYYEADKYTQIKNHFDETIKIYYNNARQKVMIENDSDYVTFEFYKNYKGQYSIERRIVPGYKKNDLPNTNFVVESYDSVYRLKDWNGFSGSYGSADGVMNNTFFPNVIGSRIINYRGKNGIVRKLTTTIYPEERYDGDEWFFSSWVKADVNEKNLLQVEISVRKLDDGVDTFKFEFDKFEKQWQILSGKLIIDGGYESITFSINYEGVNPLYIGKPHLYKKTNDIYYDYNEQNQISGLSIGTINLEFTYDEGKISKASTPSGRILDYSYNQNGDLLKIEDGGSLYKIENFYENKNLIQQKHTSFDGKTLGTKYTYDVKKQITKFIDENNLETTYLYDKFGQLLEVQDASGIVSQSKYDKRSRIIEKKAHLNDQIEGATFNYDIFSKLYQIKAKNNTEYEFDYSTEGQLKNVKVNGSNLENRLFEKTINSFNTGLITQKRYGANPNNKFNYSYDNKLRLTTKTLNEVDIVSIDYDDDNSKIQITDNQNQMEKEIKYNLKNQVKQINIAKSNQEESKYIYDYDNLGSLQKRVLSHNNISKGYDYDYSYEFQEYSLDAYLDRVSLQYLNDYMRPNKKGHSLYSDNVKLMLFDHLYDININQNIMRFNDKHGCLVYDESNINENRVDLKIYGDKIFRELNWNATFEENKVMYGWFKFSGHIDSEREIMRLGELILLIGTNKKLILRYQTTLINTNLTVFFNEWQLISLGIVDYFTYVNINGRYSEHYIPYEGRQVNFLSIGSYPLENPTQTYLDNKSFEPSSLIMDVLYVGYGTTNPNFSAFYKEGIKYLETPMNEQKEQMTYYNHTIYEDSEVITLNGTLLTTKDNQPTTYFYTDKNYKSNKTRLFEFDHHLQRHTYGSYRKQVNYDTTRKSLLTYNLDYNQSGSINLFVKPTSKDKYKHRTILSFYSNQNCLVDLYIDDRYQLKGVINGAFYDFTFKLNMDEWNMITFLFEPNQVWMSLNNSPLTRRGLFNLSLAGTTLVVGSTLNVNEPENHFEGNFQMISIWSKLLDTNAIAKIYNLGLPITIQTKLDLNNRLKSKNIVHNNQVLTKKYQYYDDFYTENNEEKQHMKLLPTSELDIDGTETVYIYDEHSNVIRKEIINSLGKPELTIDYTYDELKRLSSETVSNVTIDESNPTNPSRTEMVVEKFEYRYDQNGNIIEKKKYNHQTVEYVDIYYYDIAIKDRLEKIRRTTNNQTQDIFSLTYDTNTKFWPISFTDIKGQHTLQWQGTQLKSFGSYQYSYDEAGIRIKKSGAGTNVEYDLEGSKVVRSINHNEHKELNYHFDQHDQLVGFNYEGKEFIYQRNILGEIYGIIDLYGKQYVTYKYTAYGVPIPEEGTNLTTQEKTIATDLKRLNIYLYKGYIYDTETGLYYCQSRYYHPQIGRWLSIDSIDYLNPGAIGGLNLYAYCGNNPVMLMDGSGNSPVPWWSWVISGVQLAVGIALVATGVGAGLGVSLIIGGGIGLISNAFDQRIGQFFGGTGSIANGWGAISTGTGLLSFGPIGWVLGGGLMLIGAGTMIFGANEVAASITGNNYIQQWTGMSDSAYGWTYLGLNIASAAGTIAGQYYMKYNPPFPGNNPNKIPKGFEDRVNPNANYTNSGTGQSLRPDLNHPKPIGPHWDWRDSNGDWWRLYRFRRIGK